MITIKQNKIYSRNFHVMCPTALPTKHRRDPVRDGDIRYGDLATNLAKIINNEKDAPSYFLS